VIEDCPSGIPAFVTSRVNVCSTFDLRVLGVKVTYELSVNVKALSF